MTIEAVFRKIDRYLKKENVGVLIVDVQNKFDLDTMKTHYNLPQNTFINVSDSTFCKADEFPSIADLLNFLTRNDGNSFICEVSSFARMEGENALKQLFMELLSVNNAGHVVIFTYQCETFLEPLINNDRRLESRICIVKGEKTEFPQFIFTMKDVKWGEKSIVLNGIHKIAKIVESGISGVIYVETKKAKSNYPFSLYSISEIKNSYEVLCKRDHLTMLLSQTVGTDADWQYVLNEFQTYSSWERLISAKIGNIHNLDMAILNYQNNCYDKKWRWLYFVALKLFGATSNQYLNTVVQKSEELSAFVSNLFRCILEVNQNSKKFEQIYDQRKSLLKAIGNPVDEVINFCKIVLSREHEALYYLTDNTIQEKELIFRLLDKYGFDYEKNELFTILKKIYPDLYDYLMPYPFENALLNDYFQEYKYQKVINKIFPDFLKIVEQQAIAREYNIILQPRSSVIEKIDITKAQTYFTDAMGVEYLGFIMKKCQEFKLMVKVTVCRSELPSITSHNKEFWNVFATEQYPIITFDQIDKIKHHGEEGYDYSRPDGKLPIHLIRELELIENLLKKIEIDLVNGSYNKAILVSDHGASRLAVIHETENFFEMKEKGKHSGRCCPKNEIDIQPDNATDADDFWVLANYDRFKEGRKANVEVHGGATLEEVTVPIIEIVRLNTEIEVKIMPIDASATFTGIPEILVSFRKKAAIKIFATEKLVDVSIKIDGHTYDAKAIDENFYVVEAMPEIRRAKTYQVDIFTSGNKIASVPLRVRKESGSEKNIL